jgi:hypothetical protein
MLSPILNMAGMAIGFSALTETTNARPALSKLWGYSR